MMLLQNRVFKTSISNNTFNQLTMNLIRNMLKTPTYGNAADAGLMVLRIGVGLLMMHHGWTKLVGFNEMAVDFYDLLGLGGHISLGLTIFGEFFCSLLLLIGLGTRLALIPLIILILVIVLDVKGEDPFGEKELVLVYFFSYVCLWLTGPGKYSIDFRLHSK